MKISYSSMGYSWSGGTVAKLSEAIHVSPYSGIVPMHMALVDAVELGTDHLAKPAGYYRGEEYRPPVRSLFNRYQEHSPATQENAMRNEFLVGINRIIPSGVPQKNDLALLLEKVFAMGYPAHGRAYGELNGDDQESLGLNEDHFSIDDLSTLDVKTENGRQERERDRALILEAKRHITEALNEHE